MPRTENPRDCKWWTAYIPEKPAPTTMTSASMLTECPASDMTSSLLGGEPVGDHRWSDGTRYLTVVSTKLPDRCPGTALGRSARPPIGSPGATRVSDRSGMVMVSVAIQAPNVP